MLAVEVSRITLGSLSKLLFVNYVMWVSRTPLGSLSKLLVSYVWTDPCCHEGLEDNA